MNVTRLEIADAVEGAFSTSPANKADILAQATANHARTELLDTLGRLPERDYRTLRDLWPHLAGVPVGD
ncbi:DUF2795 domain-containing protein [Phytoactinopolyspora endophytica]|uniref:DUF2795 domain-containing protein n=1 Tax=Phytoactinopolyspora endophytica TaxID=1642495 RepID=UPI00101BE612|nr:DUF2795 domain-containing protein [Phytoactinopolyspora endophytica]